MVSETKTTKEFKCPKCNCRQVLINIVMEGEYEKFSLKCRCCKTKWTEDYTE